MPQAVYDLCFGGGIRQVHDDSAKVSRNGFIREALQTGPDVAAELLLKENAVFFL
jgi:hypothetical protein